MRVLGIDPGSRHLGWGIVELRGSRIAHVASGTLSCRHACLVSRLRSLVDALEQSVKPHVPEALGIETAFAGDNVRSALVLGQARGAILLAMARAGLDIGEYAPSTIKAAVTGTGRADKQQVQHMVKMLLGLGATPLALDTSDALAVAICHAQTAGSARGPLARAQTAPVVEHH